MYRLGKAAGVKAPRGFESLSLRKAQAPLGVLLLCGGREQLFGEKRGGDSKLF